MKKQTALSRSQSELAQAHDKFLQSEIERKRRETTSKPAHTQGPWHKAYGSFRDSNDPAFWYSRILNNGRTLTIGKGIGTSPEEAEANAKLIAAAPEMLEALKAVYADIELNNVKGGSDELNLMVQSAIKKATI